MSVYQNNSKSGVTAKPGGGGPGPDATEEINLDTELMSSDEKHAYLTQRLGSSEMASAYERATASADPSATATPTDDAPDSKSKVVGCTDFTATTPYSTKISNHFTLGMLSNATAYTKYDIVAHSVKGVNYAQTDIMCNLKYLATNSLDMIMDWDSTMRVGSGFRSNSNTDHGRGFAADCYFYTKGTNTRMPISGLVTVAKYLIYTLKVPFTQLLVESSGNGTGWVHVANSKLGNATGNPGRIGYSLNNGSTYHSGLPNL